MDNLLQGPVLREVSMGTRDGLFFPTEDIGELTENSIRESAHDLQHALNVRGYLYLRNALPSNTVTHARAKILSYMDSCGSKEQPVLANQETGLLDSRCGRGCVPFMEGKNKITDNPAVLEVLQHPVLFSLFEKIFQKPARTFDYKWLRAIHRGGYTGAHVDSVYMQRGTQATLTCWIPFTEVPVERGGLALCEDSHRLPSFEELHNTYSIVDLEALGVQGSGWFTEDPIEIKDRFNGVWKTANYCPGDIVIFTLRTVHMTLNNQTDHARISCDTRWYPYDATPDPRYVGESFASNESPMYGIYGVKTDDTALTMESLKTAWNFN